MSEGTKGWRVQIPLGGGKSENSFVLWTERDCLGNHWQNPTKFLFINAGCLIYFFLRFKANYGI